MFSFWKRKSPEARMIEGATNFLKQGKYDHAYRLVALCWIKSKNHSLYDWKSAYKNGIPEKYIKASVEFISSSAETIFLDPAIRQQIPDIDIFCLVSLYSGISPSVFCQLLHEKFPQTITLSLTKSVEAYLIEAWSYYSKLVKTDKALEGKPDKKESSAHDKDNGHDLVASNSSHEIREGINIQDVFISAEIFRLLWFSDGKYKNYFPKKTNEEVNIGAFSVTYTYLSSTEPSAISMNSIITKCNIQTIPIPSYYPSYEGLTSQQRWVYLNFLHNPFTPTDIGYIFIFYYGLERHLLEGNFDEAFNFILRLRDVHPNKSFQQYSANALVMSAILNNRPDKLTEFLLSMDKEYEMTMSFNTLLMVKAFSGQGITAEELVKFHNNFDFTNNRYIRQFPELFIEQLRKEILISYDRNSIPMDFNVHEMPRTRLSVYANYSFGNSLVSVPDFTSLHQLKRNAFQALNMAHEKLKVELREKRKDIGSET